MRVSLLGNRRIDGVAPEKLFSPRANTSLGVRSSSGTDRSLPKVCSLTLHEAANLISETRARDRCILETRPLPGHLANCPEKNSRSDLHEDDREGLPLFAPLDNFALIEAANLISETRARD